MREVFWAEGARFPAGVWRAVLATGIISGIAALWVSLLGRSDISAEFVFYAVLTLFLYLGTTSFRERDLRQAATSGDWSEAAVVGLSLRHGPLLILYGVVGWMAVLILNILPNLLLGVPNYAYTAQGAFSVLIVAPWREEILIVALWGLTYTFFPASSSTKFIAATAIAAGFWVWLHGGTYAGAGLFAWVNLGVSRVIYSFLDWLPTARGHPPSAVPSLIAHTLNNGYAFYILCVAATGVATPLQRVCF